MAVMRLKAALLSLADVMDEQTTAIRARRDEYERRRRVDDAEFDPTRSVMCVRWSAEADALAASAYRIRRLVESVSDELSKGD
jgi:hypothetical protein